MGIIKTLETQHPFLRCKCTLIEEKNGKQKVRIYPYKDEKNIKLTTMSVGRYWLCIKEGRILNKDEHINYKDKDRKNYDFDNIFISDKDIRHNSIKINKELGQVPYQNYYIGSEQYPEKKSDKCYILLHEKENTSKTKSIIRAVYRLCVKLGRSLEHNEKLIYKDGNRLNDDIDNLSYKIFEQGEHPFEDYYIGDVYTNKNNQINFINLYHKDTSLKNITMTVSRYKMCIKEKRILNKDEVVYPKDGNKFNNDIENLNIVSYKEYKKIEASNRRKLTPICTICCSGCNEEFNIDLCRVKGRLQQSTSCNIFCSDYCRIIYIQEGNIVEKKELIIHKCQYCNNDIHIPENVKLNILFCSNVCANKFKLKGGTS